MLNANGRYVWNTGSSKNEGRWRVEKNTIILRDDISNGIRIQPVLQSDRKWRIGPKGEIISNAAGVIGGVRLWDMVESTTQRRG